MFAVLAEDDSDAESIVAIIRRILGNERESIYRRGFGGCGALRHKGRHHIDQFQRRGATHFVVGHDADDNDPEEIRRIVYEEVIAPSGVRENACVVVPVQELEAWRIADPDAITAVIPSLRIPEVSQPERITNPKEWLKRHSRARTSRPLYSHATHNERVAKRLNLSVVAARCPSFRVLNRFILGSGR